VLRISGALIVSLAATAALGLPLADDTPAAAEKKQPAEAEVVADKVEVPLAERLPPGFKVKKRGKFTLYCKSDTPLGTRFKSETCYDEPNMRAYMLALQENKVDIDRIRNICSNPCTCGDPAAC
jgi:hypothetical protein